MQPGPDCSSGRGLSPPSSCSGERLFELVRPMDFYNIDLKTECLRCGLSLRNEGLRSRRRLAGEPTTPEHSDHAVECARRLKVPDRPRRHAEGGGSGFQVEQTRAQSGHSVFGKALG